MIRSSTARKAATPVMLAMLAGTAVGGPEGEQVVAGQADFVRDGVLTEITAADNAIINYQSFNIGANETVRFIQPGEQARVLNRVLGQDPSQINGALLSNGHVYLVNEAGVFFGNQAVVNVGAITAAAGTMTDADFLGGIDRFTGMTGAIENRGVINAGEVHFAGRLVTNLGSVFAPEGLVTMSSGDEVLIGEFGGHLFVSASGANEGGVEQQGEINAAGGRVMVGAGDMFSIAIGPGSTTKANTIDVRGGEGSIVTVSGSFDVSDTAPGRMGGTVTITGDGVAVLGADIDASGDAGGGRVYIGGGVQGQDASIANASRVNVDADSTINADAINSGDGGEVVLWSDDATLFSGIISARGGAQSGDGGFVEVSSSGWLGFFGHVSTGAPNGEDGLLLLDPVNISIVSGAAGSGADDALLDDNQLPASDAAGLDVQISDGTIEALDDTDILIAATGNIAIANLVDGELALPVTSGNTFTFNAADTFAMAGQNTITTAGGNLSITGVNGIQIPGIDTAGGDLTLQSNGLIRMLRSIDNAGLLTINALGGDRRVELAGATFDSLALDADELSLAGSLFSSSTLDLTGLVRIESIDPQATVSIAAVDGVDAFDIDIDPSTTITGPGGMRFVARTLSLSDVSGLSQLQVTTTEGLSLGGNFRMDNAETGLGGLVDLSDAGTITLVSDVLIDTDDPFVDELAGDIILDGAVVLASTPGVQTLTLDANSFDKDSNDGRIVLGDFSPSSQVGNITLFGGELVLMGDVFAPGGLDLSTMQSLNVAGDVTINTRGGNLTLGDRGLDGVGNLIIDLDTDMGDSGFLLTDAEIGGETPLGSLTIFANQIHVPDVTTSGDQLYRGQEIFIAEDLVSQGGTITFGSETRILEDVELESIGGTIRFVERVAGQGNLVTMTETGATVFEKSVFLPSLTAMGDVRFDGTAQNIIITNDIVLGEDVGRDRIDLAVGTKVIRSEMGDVIFNGPVNGPANLTVAAGPGDTSDDVPVVRFGSNVGGAESLASLTLGDGNAFIPRVATIVAANFDEDGEPLADQSFTFRTTGNLSMGQNEKLTVLGSLLIESLSGVMTLSDVTSVGDMRFNAPRIDVLSRAASTVFEVDPTQDPVVLLDQDGRTDTGVDFVTGAGVIFDSPDIRVLGSGFAQPVIAEPLGEIKIDGFQTRASNELSLEQLYFNRRTGTGGGAMRDETTVLDARATGSVTVPLAQGLPPEDAQFNEAYATAEGIFEPNPSSGELPEGDQGGVMLRSTNARERQLASDGVIWHIDLAESVRPGAGDFQVASGRLNQDMVREFRGSWNSLADALGVDKGDRDEMLSRVRSLLGVAVDQYKRSSGERFVDPQHFALFADLRSANKDAWIALGYVASIIESGDNLGMTPRETVRFRNGVLNSIKPDGIDRVDLARLVEYAGQSDAQQMNIEAPEGQR